MDGGLGLRDALDAVAVERDKALPSRSAPADARPTKHHMHVSFALLAAVAAGRSYP
jgi:hypothetical protein